MNNLLEIIRDFGRQIQISQNNIPSRDPKDDMVPAEPVRFEKLADLAFQILFITKPVVRDALEMRKCPARKIALKRGNQHILASELDSDTGLKINHFV
jgi:hypothetical protein